MRLTGLLLVLVLLAPLGGAQQPTSRAMDAAPEGAARGACPAPCYEKSAADVVRASVSVLAFSHDRYASGAASRERDTIVVPFFTVALDSFFSDSNTSSRNGNNSTNSSWSAKTLKGNASSAFGYLVVGGARSFGQTESRGTGQSSDLSHFSDAGYFFGTGSSGSLLVSRERSHGDRYDQTSESASAKRDVRAAGLRSGYDLSNSVESDHAKGTATLRVAGKVAGQSVDQRIYLPVALP